MKKRYFYFAVLALIVSSCQSELSKEKLRVAWFDEAEKVFMDNTEVLERVRTARFPLTCSLFEIAKSKGVEDTRVFENVDGTIRVHPEILKKSDDFQQLCNRIGVTCMIEGRNTPNVYCERLKVFFDTYN